MPSLAERPGSETVNIYDYSNIKNAFNHIFYLAGVLALLDFIWSIALGNCVCVFGMNVAF